MALPKSHQSPVIKALYEEYFDGYGGIKPTTRCIPAYMARKKIPLNSIFKQSRTYRDPPQAVRSFSIYAIRFALCRNPFSKSASNPLAYCPDGVKE